MGWVWVWVWLGVCCIAFAGWEEWLHPVELKGMGIGPEKSARQTGQVLLAKACGWEKKAASQTQRPFIPASSKQAQAHSP